MLDLKKKSLGHESPILPTARPLVQMNDTVVDEYGKYAFKLIFFFLFLLQSLKLISSNPLLLPFFMLHFLKDEDLDLTITYGYSV